MMLLCHETCHCFRTRKVIEYIMRAWHKIGLLLVASLALGLSVQGFLSGGTLCPNHSYFHFVEAVLAAINIGNFHVDLGNHHQLLEQLCHFQHPWQQSMNQCLNLSKNRS